MHGRDPWYFTMDLIGLVRVTSDDREAKTQHEVLETICSHVYEGNPLIMAGISSVN